MLTDAATRQKVRARAGCPGEKVTGCMGTQIEHTQVMENEIYVNQKNPLQNSIKTYMLEMKSKTNQFKSQMNKELKPVSEKQKEIWKKGMEQFDEDSKAAQRRAIVEDNNLSDYLIGKRKKYGDIQEQLGPQRYIDKVKNEKWLRSREKLSNDLQQARLKYRNDVLLNKTQPSELPKKLNEKELQKEQYNIAIDLFQVWDQDGGGELSQEEMITAFIRVGLSQDHHFAKRIMQSVRDENSTTTDIVMRDFIKLFKKDDLCERIITQIKKAVTFKKKQLFMKKLDDHHKQVMRQEREKLRERKSSFNTDTEEDLYTQTTMTRDLNRVNIEDLED